MLKTNSGSTVLILRSNLVTVTYGTRKTFFLSQSEKSMKSDAMLLVAKIQIICPNMHTKQIKSRDRRNCLAMSYLSPKMSFLANSTPSRTTTRTIFTDGFCNKQTDWHYDGPDSRNNTVHERRPTTNHFFKTLLFNNILTREGFRP